MPKISIITPVYNTEEYLQTYFKSILNQTFKDFEIICVDDSSTDNSLSILQTFAQKDSRIKIYHHEKNLGSGPARNTAIEKAQGKYFVFVDSDDTVEQKYLEKIYYAYEKYNCECLALSPRSNKTYIVRPYATMDFSISKKMIEKFPNIKYTNTRPCEDGLFNFMFSTLSNNIEVLQDITYNYIQRPTSSENTMNNDIIINNIPQWFEILEKFYDEYDLWKTKKELLLNFIYFEPYYRFQNPHMTEHESQKIFEIIHNFLDKHAIYNKTKVYNFPMPFRIFCETNSYKEYLKILNAPLMFKNKIRFRKIKNFIKNLTAKKHTC